MLKNIGEPFNKSVHCPVIDKIHQISNGLTFYPNPRCENFKCGGGSLPSYKNPHPRVWVVSFTLCKLQVQDPSLGMM